MDWLWLGIYGYYLESFILLQTYEVIAIFGVVRKGFLNVDLQTLALKNSNHLICPFNRANIHFESIRLTIVQRRIFV